MVCPAGLTTLVAEEGVVQVTFPTAVPDWWKPVLASAALRMPSPLATRSARSPATDYFGGVSSVVGSNSYQVGPDAAVGDPNGPIDANHVRIRTISAVDFAAAQLATPPAGGDEIFLFTISLNKTKTAGAGGCAGCNSPAAISLKQVKLNQPAGTGDPVISTPRSPPVVWSRARRPIFA